MAAARDTIVPFISVAGLVVLEFVTIGILSFVGSTLVGPTPPRGMRAGVFAVLAWLFIGGFIMAGRLLENLLTAAQGAASA